MNALSRIPLPPANDDMDYRASCAALADMRLGEAVEHLAQWVEAHFADPNRPRGQWERVRDAQVAISHARNLIGPITIERGRRS